MEGDGAPEQSERMSKWNSQGEERRNIPARGAGWPRHSMAYVGNSSRKRVQWNSDSL
jgi:hypothetical protein